MPSKKTGISQRAFARAMDVAHRAVQVAIQTGRISTHADGSIDEATARAEWEANTDQSKPRNAITGDRKHRRAEGEPMKPMENKNFDGDPDKLDSKSYAKSRAVREDFNAKIAQLEYEERAGKTIDKEEVKTAGFNAARAARDALLSIADRLSGVLASTNDEGEVHKILTDEFRRVLEKLSKSIDKVTEPKQ